MLLFKVASTIISKSNISNPFSSLSLWIRRTVDWHNKMNTCTIRCNSPALFTEFVKRKVVFSCCWNRQRGAESFIDGIFLRSLFVVSVQAETKYHEHLSVQYNVQHTNTKKITRDESSPSWDKVSTYCSAVLMDYTVSCQYVIVSILCGLNTSINRVTFLHCYIHVLLSKYNNHYRLNVQHLLINDT